MEDYMRILRRRIWLLAIPVVLGPVIAVIIATRLSPRYTSSSEILIDEPKVPASFVPSVESSNLISRLANMEEQIRSRSRLEPVMTQFGLYKKEVNKVPMEDLVGRMNSAIVIKPITFSKQADDTSDGRSQLPGFQISFSADTPQLAQGICNQITSMFIDANLRLQTSRAEGTAQFLDVQLQQAKQQLDQEDAELAQFKQRYFGSLPDQEQSTIQLIGTASTQLNSLTQAMNGYQQQRTYDESLLTQQLSAWKASRQLGQASPETLQAQLSGLETQLTALRTRFTDSYPDVIKAEGEVAALKAKIAQEDSASSAPHGKAIFNPASEPPQIRELRAQIQTMDLAIKNNETQQSRLRAQAASFEGKLRLTPEVEQQYKDLTRNYQTMQANYDSLLKKEEESQMSTSLEQRQEGQQFAILDPASLPIKPSFPNYWRFAGGGLVVGLIVGFGILVWLEMRDKALRDDKDIEYFLGLPTLAVIPVVGGEPRRRSIPGGRAGMKRLAG